MGENLDVRAFENLLVFLKVVVDYLIVNLNLGQSLLNLECSVGPKMDVVDELEHKLAEWARSIRMQL